MLWIRMLADNELKTLKKNWPIILKAKVTS